ncbi:hypothetical protein [Ornithinimicrobium tianjinense]|uniref:Uncharacterized protein n=1 Tax=Ornithinimicrobium tianjinense TaxID=1195761 RepID=A0A917BLU5_9MICO|nr:hypothetical protein [Ornithinimicrobium tianjinense]GGF48587.1 hypothetical protein GCM10011366_15540 [Ornithinimicrobium tianjinense]
MHPLSRTSAALASLALVTMTASAAVASPPRMYHSVSVESASFDSVRVDGCLQTEIFAAATTGHWAGRHGPSVRQQGPTSVFVRVTDLCASPAGITAAAGPRGAVVLQVEATSMDVGLRTDQHLRSAVASGALEGTDQDGAPVQVGMDVHWTAAGPLEHSTLAHHTRLPEGQVTAADNAWRRAATATATVTLDGRVLTGTDEDSAVERVKSHCIEVPTGRFPPEDFYPCFGFPG